MYTIRRKSGIKENWPALDICMLIGLSVVFLNQKNSIRCEVTGYLFHDVYEKQQQVRWDRTGIGR